MSQKVVKLSIDEVTPEKLIDVFIRTLGFEKKPLAEYTQSELIQLLNCASSICAETILNGLGLTGTNLQEQLDQLIFSARKDSTTSSMRPSSDMPRRQKKADMTDDTEESTSAANHGETPDSGSDENNRTNPHSDQSNDSEDHTDRSNANKGDTDEADAEAQYRKNRDKGFRTFSGKPAGRQPGTKGLGGFQIPENAERKPEEVIPPDRCTNCPKWEECRKHATLGPCRNVVDVEFKVTVTPVRNAEVICPEMEAEVETGDAPVQASMSSQYPENVNSTNQYGVRIATLVTCLYCVGMTSLRRIRDILAPMLQLSISPATMLKFVNTLAGKISHTVDSILDELYWEGHVHCDETGAKVNGEMHWLHTICTETYTFLSIQKKRGREGMDAIGFLLTYTGTVIHDCWASYWSYTECEHAICNEHILRELKGLSAFFQHASEWADDMASLLRDMLHARHLAEEAGLDHIEQGDIDRFSERFDTIITRGKALHPIADREPGKRGRQKKGRARALVDRMELHKTEIFRFLSDFTVPFTNNVAESSFRSFSAKRNEMGSFRSFEEAEHFVSIMAYLSTARKQGISYYKAVEEGFLGNSDSLIFPDGLPQKRPTIHAQQSSEASRKEAG